MAPEKQRHIFISYSRINKTFALKLVKELKAAGFPVWLDQLDIPAGSRWDEELETALRECGIFLTILTPASIASENAKDEIGYAIDHGKRILPVLLEECEIPLRLRRFQYVDFTSMNYDQGIRAAKELLTKLLQEESIPISARIPATKERPTRPAINRSDVSKSDEDQATLPEAASNATSQSLLKSRALYAGLVIFVLLAFLGGASFLGWIFPSPKPTPTIAPTQEIKPTAPSSPTVIADTATPELKGFYTEEFDGSPDAWTFFKKSGKEVREFSYSAKDGKWSVQIVPKGDEPWGYLINPSFSYTDVQLEVVTKNSGNNSNGVSLVCRYSDEGWYEFWVSNNGNYGIYAFGPGGAVLQAGYELAKAASPSIHTGKSENTYTAMCKGNELSLAINGKSLPSVKTKYDFREGNIGIGFSAFQNRPTNVDFESLRITQP